MTYREFLENKIDIAPQSGIEVDPAEISPALKDHQRVCVLWALRGGRRGLFARFGLGKTVMQLEWCRILQKHIGGQTLIVMPLNVMPEFRADAVHLLGLDEPPYCRTMAEVKACQAPIILTNYERVRDGDIDPHYFTAVSLDEAATLRSFGSKTYQEFMQKFKGVRYKLTNTATPSPNRYKELIHYAGFLEVMDTGQALTRFFKRDSTKANNLTLYPGREREFWIWCASWGLFLQKPSDLGFSDEGYSLPPMDIRYHKLTSAERPADFEPDGQLKLGHDAAMGLTDAAREKRDSIEIRAAETARIVAAAPTDHFVIWHDLEEERRALKRALPEISRSSSSSISSPSNVASASCSSNLLRSMEYNASSRIFRLSRYALYSTSSASAYSARFGEARGEKSSLGIASKNLMKLPPTGDNNDWTIDLES